MRRKNPDSDVDEEEDAEHSVGEHPYELMPTDIHNPFDALVCVGDKNTVSELVFSKLSQIRGKRRCCVPTSLCVVSHGDSSPGIIIFSASQN